ncbi:hypothetical protein LTR84_006889 [Exophiala bonariae]|uniref:Zn(2)-C6 fungal-type domain-containing protein n=1 Tax=Exophiala bonariae TaxID=1690606 RepID=A0AAV9N093_9EURO|nr:hypothetical protein LTR84_006889 [Exophiala bonariae]
MAALDYVKRDGKVKGPMIHRRSHTKSKAGCLSCKIRRIKCSEEKPTCTNCVRRSRICEWPAPRLNPIHLRFGNSACQTSVEPPKHSVSSVNDGFTLRDLRLFHHFLNHASPSLPLGNQGIWVRDIPQLVHEYDHLMHALLALGASHISSRTTKTGNTEKDNYRALEHRGRAIAGLKKAFSQNEGSPPESDAMLATCYALAFQSAHVSNGSLDFATFVRGCAMITRRIQSSNENTVFQLSTDTTQCPTNFSPSHVDSPLNFQLPPHLANLLTQGARAIQDTEPYMVQHRAESNFYHGIYATLMALQHSPATGYGQFLSFYAVWFKMAEDSLDLHLTSGLVRDSAQLLWAYFIGLQLLILVIVNQATMENGVPLLEEARDLRSTRLSQLTVTLAWFQAIVQSTPDHLQQYVTWPRQMADEVTAVFDVPKPGDKDVQGRLSVLQNLNLQAHTVLVSILDISATLTNWTEDGLASVARLGALRSSEIRDGIQHVFRLDRVSAQPHQETAVFAGWQSQPSTGSADTNGVVETLDASEHLSTAAPTGLYSRMHDDLDVLYGSDMLHLHSRLMV